MQPLYLEPIDKLGTHSPKCAENNHKPTNTVICTTTTLIYTHAMKPEYTFRLA